MQECFGIEVINNHEQINLLEEIQQLVTLVDYNEMDFFIVPSLSDAKTIVELYDAIEISTQIMPLFRMLNSEKMELFEDYGFTLSSQCYLMKEMVIPFTIIGGEEKQIEMALLQFQEHLIAIEKGEVFFYFIDQSLMDLIKGIAYSYDIEVSLF